MARLGRSQPANVVYSDNITTITAPATITPSTVAAIVAVPAPSIPTPGTFATVAAIAAIPSVTITATATVPIGTVAAVVAVPAPGVVTTGSTVVLSTVAVIVTIPAPDITGAAPIPTTGGDLSGRVVHRPTRFAFIVEDIMSGQIKTQDLALDDWAYDDTLNRPGSLNGRIPLTSDFANEEILDPWRTAIYVTRDGRIEWGGILTPPRLSLGASSLDISCFGWLGYWDRRFIGVLGVTYVQADQFLIFDSLIRAAQNEVTWGAGFDLGIDVTWDALSGVLRDRSYYGYAAKNLGEALRQLAAVNDGFDYAMTYAVNTATDRIDKAIKLFYPRKGRTTNFLYEYKRDAKTNILARGFADPVELAWAGSGWGAGNEYLRLRQPYTDATLRGVYPPYEAMPAWSSVIEQATLNDHTAAAFARTNRPRRIPILRVDPNASPVWGDAEIGDTVGVRIDDGYGSTPGVIPQQVRITGTKVSAAGEYNLIITDPSLEETTDDA